MDWADIIKIVFGVIASTGAGGIIVLGLSSWLGKILAERIMENEKQENRQKLEQLRSELRNRNETNLQELRNELDIYKEIHLRGHSDKLATYRLVIDIISDYLADIDLWQSSGQTLPDGNERFDRFNRDRLKTYGYLSMIAPQEVMDANDTLTDHLLDITVNNAEYNWEVIRNHAIGLLNAIRRDLNPEAEPIEYRGSR